MTLIIRILIISIVIDQNLILHSPNKLHQKDKVNGPVAASLHLNGWEPKNPLAQKNTGNLKFKSDYTFDIYRIRKAKFFKA